MDDIKNRILKYKSYCLPFLTVFSTSLNIRGFSHCSTNQYGLLVNLFLSHMTVSPRSWDLFCSFILLKDPASISFCKKSNNSTSSWVFNLAFSRRSSSVMTWLRVLTWICYLPVLAEADPTRATKMYLNIFIFINYNLIFFS